MILSAYHNRSVKIHWNAVLMGRKASPLFSLFENRGRIYANGTPIDRGISYQDASCSVPSDARQLASLRSS